MAMVSPCPKCGDMRAEPLYRSIFYPLFKRLGYRLSECGRCRRKRLVPRHKNDKHRHTHAEGSKTRAEVTRATEKGLTIAPAPTAESASLEASPDVEAATTPERHHRRFVCPCCGSRDCRASRRRLWERMVGKPHMLRCRKCRKRFPRPQTVASAAEEAGGKS